MSEVKLISIIVPCYNEKEVILETNKRLRDELEKIYNQYNLKYELIYVNDGSKDNTLRLLQLQEEEHNSNSKYHGKIVVLSLSRNFGHQSALSAGLFHAKGDAIVSIDADLQDPPEVICKMIEKWQEGVDVVYGARVSREGESFFKLMTAKIFYRLVRYLTQTDIPVDAGDFRLMSRQALDIFNSMPEGNRFIRGMIPWIGLKQEPVFYERAARFAGTTKYPFRKMLKLAFDGITSFSSTPLKLSYYMGFFVAGFAIIYALYIIFFALVYKFPIVGWSSLMVTILFIGAVQLIAIGILGEYLGRVYDEVKKRPLFIVDKKESRF